MSELGEVIEDLTAGQSQGSGERVNAQFGGKFVCCLGRRIVRVSRRPVFGH